MRIQHHYLPNIAHCIHVTIFLCSITKYAADSAKNKCWFVEETGIEIAKKQQFPECLSQFLSYEAHAIGMGSKHRQLAQFLRTRFNYTSSLHDSLLSDTLCTTLWGASFPPLIGPFRQQQYLFIGHELHTHSGGPKYRFDFAKENQQFTTESAPTLEAPELHETLTVMPCAVSPSGEFVAFMHITLFKTMMNKTMSNEPIEIIVGKWTMDKNADQSNRPLLSAVKCIKTDFSHIDSIHILPRMIAVLGKCTENDKKLLNIFDLYSDTVYTPFEQHSIDAIALVDEKPYLLYARSENNMHTIFNPEKQNNSVWEFDSTKPKPSNSSAALVNSQYSVRQQEAFLTSLKICTTE